MQIKVGIDIIETKRIQESIEKLGDKFINKVFTNQEISYCQNKKKAKYEHYAARFAAKEATFKAISTLLDDKYSISWKNIQVINDEKGKPQLEFLLISKEVEKNLNKIESIDISLSHLENLAIANVSLIMN